MQDLVSVIVPIYNTQKYLSKCIESLLTQTYKNIEIILVDDGSSDNSLELCNIYASEDSRIKVIHKHNQGVSIARNIGIREAKGKYIVFVDSDDYCHIKMIEKLKEQMEVDDSDIAFCGFYLLSSENNIKIISPKEKGLVSCKEAAYYINFDSSYSCMPTNKMYRTELIKSKNGDIILFNPQYHIGEDIVWLSHMLIKGNKVSLINEALYYHRIYNGSSCHNVMLDKRNYSHFKALHEYIMVSKSLNINCAKIGMEKIYNALQNMKVLAYSINSTEDLLKISSIYKKEYKRVWFMSKHIKLVRKCKFVLTDILIALHFPGKIVAKIYNFGNKQG